MKCKLETEAKIKVDKPQFEKLAARFGPESFTQRNDFFKNKDEEIIRLRFEKGKKILTRKTRTDFPSRFKIKKEEETFLDADESILEFFGFKRFFSYTKKRANFELRGCVVSLDEIKGNYYLEVEGTEEDIESALLELNLEEEVPVKMSYFDILSGK